MRKLPVLVALLSAAGCIRDPSPCDGEPECLPPPTDVIDVLTVTPNLDLLVLVDDSGSMAEKQAAFRAAFPSLLDELAALEGGLPNLHLGVISPDMGATALDGQTAPPVGVVGQGGCAAGGKHGALQLGAATLSDEHHFATLSRDGTKNFEGELVDVFGQLSTLGTSGCGFEQPLAAVRAALSSGVAENAGFVRRGANLAVLVLSDEDDCSAEHTTLFGPDSPELGAQQSFRCFRFGVECDEDTVSPGVKTNCRPAGTPQIGAIDPLAEALLATKQDPRRVMFGGIVGTTDPVEVVTRQDPGGTPQTALAASCRYTSSGGSELTADPAIRLTAFADSFEHARVESICATDLAPATSRLGQQIAAMMTDHCVPAGFQEGACFVEDHRDADPAYQRTLSSCVGAPTQTCFQFVVDPTCASGQRLSIARISDSVGDEWSTLRCRR